MPLFHSTRKLSLVFAAAALCATATKAVAQFPTEYRWSVSSGTSLLLPFDFYDGEVSVRSSRLPGAVGANPADSRPVSYVTRYTEYVDRLTEVWASGTILRDDSHFLSLRARGGFGTVSSTVRGTVLPSASRNADLRWLGVDIQGGFQITGRRLAVRFSGGPALLRGSLGSRERRDAGSAVVRVLSTDTLFPLLLPWGDRSWTARGWVVGLGVRFRPHERLTFSVTGEHHVARMNFGGLERSHAEEYRALGQNPAVSYEGFTTMPQGLSLSVEWRVGARRVEDPGDAAIAALSALQASAAAAGVAPPDWRDELPADVRLPLLAGDTAGAIEVLERLEPSHRDDPLIIGTLGMLLAATAPALETQLAERLRAQRLLERALTLDGKNPRYAMALGLILEKRVMHIDARRVLTRGIAAAADRPDEVTAAELAELFFQRGLALESWVLDFEDTDWMPPAATGNAVWSAVVDEFATLDLDPADAANLEQLRQLLEEIVGLEELERIRVAAEHAPISRGSSGRTARPC